MTVIHADCLDAMAAMDADSVDAIVCDPPYALTANKKGGSGAASVDTSTPYGRARIGVGNGAGGFMGMKWDSEIPSVQMWTEALRVAKPGAHLVAFGGTRTYHRLACAIEDAGWEVRDCLSFLYGSGFPKSHNLDKTGAFCGCVPSAERDVRLVRNSDVSPPVQSQEAGGQVLLAGVPESGAPTNRAASERAQVRPIESGVEGRRHLEAPEGELLGRPVRPSAGMGAADGAEGRLHIGASVGHGAEGAAIARPDGSGASPEPRPIGQSTGEPGTLADERIAQAGGVWPTCDGCGKPRIARGLGTALKPAWEPIILARKPLIGTVAANVAAHGTGALNVDGCRLAPVGKVQDKGRGRNEMGQSHGWNEHANRNVPYDGTLGRWPANVCLDEDAAAMLDEQSGERKGAVSNGRTGRPQVAAYGDRGAQEQTPSYGDTGGASRFFYTAKASRREREAGLEGMPKKRGASTSNGGVEGRLMTVGAASLKGEPVEPPKAANHHPTVKPIALMRWLCRLVTPPNGLILDPFTGSGTTGCAAVLEGFRFVGIEREAEYVAIAEKRIAHWAGQRTVPEPDLFGDAA